MFIDTHAHINKNIYEDISQVINDAKDSNVLKIINASENIFTSKEAIELNSLYKGVLYPAVGIHPLNMDVVEKKDLKALEELVKNNKVIAIGEIGLDYYYSKEYKDKQKYFFRRQLDIALKYNLPIIVHSREATKDIIDILKEYNLSGIIHCFNGSLEIAREYIKMGYLLGIGGVLTFKNSKLKEVVKEIPLENLVLETDSPFLTPDPYRKHKNEPKYISNIAEYLANIKEKSMEEVEKVTTDNACRIFDFSIY